MSTPEIAYGDMRAVSCALNVNFLVSDLNFPSLAGKQTQRALGPRGRLSLEQRHSVERIARSTDYAT